MALGSNSALVCTALPLVVPDTEMNGNPFAWEGFRYQGWNHDGDLRF